MKKIALCCLAVFCVFLCAACGSSEKQKADTPTGTETYISETEARIFFYEITSVYRYELMTLDEETLKNGVDPKYWDGVAEEAAELSLSELTEEYVTEEERELLATSYGVTADNVIFGVYRVGDLQAGIDYLFGPGRSDVSTWNHDNVDIVGGNIFGTASGYFLCAKTEDKRYDNQIYKLISVTGGEGTATIQARALSVDTITEQTVRDLTVTETVTDEGGNEMSVYHPLENAAIENFSINADFDTNINNMGINENDLGVVTFTFGLSGISVYLDHAAVE
ncbi:MAG: hypothetical protein ACOX8R_10620 [Bacillota bacterium]|jgi:hypothetical protein